MKPITSISSAGGRIDVFGLGADNAALHRSLDGPAWAPAWDSLGGVFASSLAVASRGDQLVDVFGLGTDFALFHRAWNGSAWSPQWERLGGVFSSPPAAVCAAPGTLDVFGLGTDHALFHRRWTGSAWTANWESLGGAFTSQPEVVVSGPNRIDVFVVGADFAMHHRAYGPAGWTNWESLGGVFISQPSALAWRDLGPGVVVPPAAGTIAAPGVHQAVDHGLITVFGLGTDNSLFAKTWDGANWSANWLPLAGSFSGPVACTSSAVGTVDVFATGTDGALHHRRLKGVWGAWDASGGGFSSPPTAVSAGPNRIDVFCLGVGLAMQHRAWNGNAWTSGWQGLQGQFGLQGTFRFSLDSVEIVHTRAPHEDDVHVAVTLAVGGRAMQTLTRDLGSLNDGIYPLSMTFAPVTVDLGEFVVFNYAIVNSGHNDGSTVETELKSVLSVLSGKGVEAAKAAIAKGLSKLVGAAIGTAILPVIGTALGDIAVWLAEKLELILFANCDGPVAVEQAALPGTQLRHYALAGGPVTQHTTHPGTESDPGCFGNSLYKVAWSYRRVDHS